MGLEPEAGRAGDPFRGRWRRLRWAVPALLAAVAYAPALHDPILHDDKVLISKNTWLATQAGPATVFAHDFWYGSRVAGTDLYRPLTVLSIAWNLRAAGSPAAFHAVNVALHAIACYLAAWMLLAVAGTAGERDARAAFAAWISASILAVHPLASEAVIWIAGRAEILSAAFGLAAFALFVALGDRERLGGAKLAASAVLFFLALASKESAAVWILIGCAWVVVFRRRIRAPRRALLLRGAVYGAAFVAFLLSRASAVGWGTRPPTFVDNPLVTVDPMTRIANAVLLLGFYAFKMIWPRTLSIDWAYDQLRVVPLAPAAVGALALVAGWLAVAWRLRRSPRAQFLWVFVPAAFAVTANVVLPIGTNFGERLAYLPLIGACGLAGMALARVRWPAAAKGTVLAVVLVAATARTALRATDFRSAEALYAATSRATPRAVKSLASLGLVRLYSLHRPDLAIPPLQRAVAVWPDYPRALAMLAEAYARTGRREEAIETARRAEAAAAKLRAEHGGSPADGN